MKIAKSGLHTITPEIVIRKLVIEYDEEDANMLLTNTHTSIDANITASYDYFIKANEGEWSKKVDTRETKNSYQNDLLRISHIFGGEHKSI